MKYHQNFENIISRKFSKLIVSPDMVKPSQDNLEVIGTFNPGVITCEDMTYFLIRVAERPKEKREGYYPLPKVENGKIAVNWQKMENLTVLDERAVVSKADGFLCLTNISHLRLAKSKDGINIDSIAEVPTLFPEGPYEEYGIEDARITHIGDKFYITYVAVSNHGIATSLVSTKDFVEFEKHGIIFPTENKDVVIFPEKVGGRYVAFHRPLSANPLGPPEMWMSFSPDLINWGHHCCVVKACSDCKVVKAQKVETTRSCQRRRATDWDFMKVGAGAPPVKTKEGWLEIYHGSFKAHEEDTVGIYCGGAALFDLNDPNKLIARAKRPILVPETEFDRRGFLNNIVFPTAVALDSDDLLVYYGAADTYTAVTKLSLHDVLKAAKS